MRLMLPRLMSKAVKDEMVLLAEAVNPDNVFIADPDMEADYKKHLEDADKENKSECSYIRTFLKQFKEGDKLYEEAKLLQNYVNLYETVCSDIELISKADDDELKHYHRNLQELGPKIEILLGKDDNTPGLAAVLDKFNLKSNFDYVKNSSLKSLSAISENIEHIAMSFEKMAMINRQSEMNARRRDADTLEDYIEQNKKEIDKVRQYVVKYDLFDPKDRDIQKQEAGLKVSEIQKDINEVEEKIKANSTQRVPMRLRIERLDEDAKEIESDIKVYEERRNEIQASIDADTNKLVELSDSQKKDRESREYAQKIANLNKKQIEDEYTETLNKKAALDSLKLIEGVKELDGKAKVFSDFSERLGSSLLTIDRVSQLANNKFVSSMSKNDPLYTFYDKFTKAYEEFHPVQDNRGMIGSIFKSKPQPGVDKLKEIISEGQKRETRIKNLINKNKGKRISELEEIELKIKREKTKYGALEEYQNWLKPQGRIMDSMKNADQLFTLEKYGVDKLGLTEEEVADYREYQRLSIKGVYNEGAAARDYILPKLKDECDEISQSYIKSKDNIKGYKESQALQAKLDQLKPQLVAKVVDDKEVAKENYNINTEEYQKLNNNISFNTRLLNTNNSSIAEKNKKLEQINLERYPLYDEHDKLCEEYADLNQEKKNLQKEQDGYKRIIKFCDNLDSMKKKCDAKRETVEKSIDNYKKIYGPMNANDARRTRIQKKLDSFIARINIDKGIRGNTDEYELMVTRLREARNVFEEPNLSVNKIQSALTTAASAAENYLNLKKQQKMVLGTDRRHSRIRFANEIKSFTSKMAENLNTNLPPEDLSEKEHKMLNYNKDNLAKFEDVKSASLERKAADKSYLYTL